MELSNPQSIQRKLHPEYIVDDDYSEEELQKMLRSEEQKNTEFYNRIQSIFSETDAVEKKIGFIKSDFYEVKNQFSVDTGDMDQEELKQPQMLAKKDENPDDYCLMYQPDTLSTYEQILQKTISLDINKDIKELSTIVQLNNGDFIIGGMCKSFMVFNNQFMLLKKVLVMDQIFSCLNIGDRLYFGLSNETVKVFDTATYEEITTIKVAGNPYVLVQINDEMVGAGGYNGQFHIIDHDTHKILLSQQFPATIFDIIKIRSQKDNEYAFATEKGLQFATIEYNHDIKKITCKQTTRAFNGKFVSQIVQIGDDDLFMIYIKNDNGKIKVFSKRNSSVFKEFPISGTSLSSIQPLICEDEKKEKYIAVKDDDYISIISLKNYEIKYQIKTKYVQAVRKQSMYQSIHNEQLRLIYVEHRYDKRNIMVKFLPLKPVQ